MHFRWLLAAAFLAVTMNLTFAGEFRAVLGQVDLAKKNVTIRQHPDSSAVKPKVFGVDAQITLVAADNVKVVRRKDDVELGKRDDVPPTGPFEMDSAGFEALKRFSQPSRYGRFAVVEVITDDNSKEMREIKVVGRIHLLQGAPFKGKAKDKRDAFR